MFGGFSFDPFKSRHHYGQITLMPVYISRISLTNTMENVFDNKYLLYAADDISLAEKVIQRKMLFSAPLPEKLTSARSFRREVGKEQWIETVRRL